MLTKHRIRLTKGKSSRFWNELCAAITCTQMTLAKTFRGEGNLTIWTVYKLFEYNYGADYQCMEPETEI